MDVTVVPDTPSKFASVSLVVRPRPRALAGVNDGPQLPACHCAYRRRTVEEHGTRARPTTRRPATKARLKQPGLR